MPDLVDGYIYGLRDIKLTTIDGVTQVDLPASQTLTWSEEFVNASLKGDDKTVSTVGFLDKLSWNLSAGGISLEALSIITGKTVTTTGTTPNRVQEITRQAGDNSPYFKIYGRALGDNSDGVHVLIKKAKLTSLQGNLQGENFYISQCSGEAIGDDSDDLYDIKKLETDAALPSS